MKRRPCDRHAECSNTNVRVPTDSMIELQYIHQSREATSVNANSIIKEMVLKLVLLIMHVNLEVNFTIVVAMIGVSVEAMEIMFVK